MKHCDEVFTKKHKVSPLANNKSFYKLKEAAEKCKKILSANLDASIHIDCLLEDEDLTVNFKREAFEELAVPVFDKLAVLFNRFKTQLATKNLKLN